MSSARREKDTPRYIEQPLRTTEGCRYCLMCRHVCPVGHVTFSETLSPHGWALLIASVKRGVTGWDSESIDVLYKCADCGLCQSDCATDQPLPTAIAAARAQLVEQGLAPATVSSVDQSLRKWKNPYAPEEPQKVQGKGKTALFVGDAARYLEPATLEAALCLLQKLKIQPVLVGNGRSSGLIGSSLGLSATAKELARELLEEITQSEPSTLLVLSPGDLYALKTLYKERLNLDFPAQVEVVELVSFLHQASRDKKITFRQSNSIPRFAYHDPCHSPRIQRNPSPPRELIGAVFGNSGENMFWRESRAHPCGAVGGLNLTQPLLAKQLAEARFEDARKAGASCLITEDPLCLHHLKKHAPRGMEVRGLFEILASSL